MNVSLTPHFEELIQKSVESGRYDNANEVLRVALRLFERAEREERLRQEIQIGIDQFERGEVIPYGPDFCERVKLEAEQFRASGEPYNDAVVPPDFVLEEGGSRPGRDL